MLTNGLKFKMAETIFDKINNIYGDNKLLKYIKFHNELYIEIPEKITMKYDRDLLIRFDKKTIFSLTVENIYDIYRVFKIATSYSDQMKIMYETRKYATINLFVPYVNDGNILDIQKLSTQLCSQFTNFKVYKMSGVGRYIFQITTTHNRIVEFYIDVISCHYFKSSEGTTAFVKCYNTIRDLIVAVTND